MPSVGNIAHVPSVSINMCSSMRRHGSKQADEKFILDFIEVYRGLPTLWDVKCTIILIVQKKCEQYEVLVEKYHEKYPDAEKQEVVKKIHYCEPTSEKN